MLVGDQSVGRLPVGDEVIVAATPPTGGINPLSGLIHSGDMGMMPAKNLIVVKALSILILLLAM